MSITVGLTLLAVLVAVALPACAVDAPLLSDADRIYATFNRYRAMAHETKDVRGKEKWEARQLLRQYSSSSSLFRTYARDYAEVLFPDDAQVAPVRRMRTAILATAFRYDGDDWRENFIDYVAAVAMAESKFRPQVVSWVGARGVMQIMPNTARDVAANLTAARMQVIPSHADKALSSQVMHGIEYLSWMICEAYVREKSSRIAEVMGMDQATVATITEKDAFFALFAYVREGDRRRVRALVKYLKSERCDQLAALRVCRIAAAMYNAGPYHAVIAQGDVPKNGQTDFYVSEVIAYWNRNAMSREDQTAMLATVLRMKHETIQIRVASAWQAWTAFVVAAESAYPHPELMALRDRMAKKYRHIPQDFPSSTIVR
jgi:hypothetical protein